MSQNSKDKVRSTLNLIVSSTIRAPLLLIISFLLFIIVSTCLYISRGLGCAHVILITYSYLYIPIYEFPVCNIQIVKYELFYFALHFYPVIFVFSIK